MFKPHDPWRFLREDMVDQQLIPRGITDRFVLEVMRELPRHLFMPPNQGKLAYGDHPMEIEQGQTIPQPFLCAFLAQACQLTPGEKVLEIGTGSGYQAAIFTRLGAQTYSIERNSIVLSQARKTLSLLGVKVQTTCGQGVDGWSSEAPFDVIVLTGSVKRLPTALLDQVCHPGGRVLVAIGPPAAQTLTRVHREGQQWIHEPLLTVQMTPLTLT